jgi:hypothetical protein
LKGLMTAVIIFIVIILVISLAYRVLTPEGKLASPEYVGRVYCPSAE